MPSNIQLPLATFTNPTIHNLPNIAGLDFWTFFGTSIAASPNQGGGGGWANAGSGPIAWQPNYFTGTLGFCLQSVNQFVNSSFATSGVTEFLVARHVAGSGTTGATVSAMSAVPGIVTFQPFSGAAAATGISGFISGTPNPVLLGPASTPPAANVTINTGAFKCYAIQGGTAGAVTHLYDLTDGYQADAATAGAVAGGALSMFIGGSSATPGNDRRVDVAFFAKYATLLTKPQIDQIYAALKDLLLLRPGVPIIV
jgi:hypothetical protein